MSNAASRRRGKMFFKQGVGKEGGGEQWNDLSAEGRVRYISPWEGGREVRFRE